MLHTIADEWMWRRAMLAALGVKDNEPWQTVLDGLGG